MKPSNQYYYYYLSLNSWHHGAFERAIILRGLTRIYQSTFKRFPTYLAVCASVATAVARVNLVPTETAQFDPALGKKEGAKKEERVSKEEEPDPITLQTLKPEDGFRLDREAGSYFMMAAAGAPTRATPAVKRKRGSWETGFYSIAKHCGNVSWQEALRYHGLQVH